jgi:hypothetical protein
VPSTIKDVRLQPLRTRPAQIALLAGLLLTAGVLRGHRIGDQDLWFDELWSLLNAGGRQAEFLAVPHGEVLRDLPRLTDPVPGWTVADIWRGMRTETHPPLYFILLAFWRDWFGDGAGALRMLSATCSWLALIPLAFAVRIWSGTHAALWTLALGAFAAGDLAMAQSTRHYAPAALWVATSFALLAWWSRATAASDAPITAANRASPEPPRAKRPALWAALYGLALVLAMLTHYMSALPLLGQGVWAARFLRGSGRRVWIAATAAAAVVFLAAWGPSAVAQWRYTQGTGDKIVFLDHQPIWRTPLELLTAPVRLLIPVRPLALTLPLDDGEPLELFTSVVSHDVGLAAVGAILVAVCLRGALRRREPALWFFLAWFVAPMLVLVAGELTTGRTLLHHLRYPFFAVHGLCALIPLSLAGLHRGRGRLLLSVFVGIGFLLTLASYPTRRNPDSTAAAAFAVSNVSNEDLLVLDAFDGPAYWARSLLLHLNHHAPTVLPPMILLRGEGTAETQRKIDAFDRIWLIHSWADMQHTPLPPSFVRAEIASEYFYGVGWFLRIEKGPAGEGQTATDE